MKNQKILIALVIILAIGLIVEGGYLISLKKRVDSFGSISARSNSPVFSKKATIPRFAQRAFDNDWYWDDFFSDEWKPFEEMKHMQQQLNKMFNESFGRGMRSQGFLPSDKGSFFEPDIDIKEDKTHYMITMDLPGMDKDKISVEIKNKVLRVSGERETVLEENKGDKFFRQERSYGHFSRAIPLPDNIKENEVSADYKNGVLTIKVAKAITEGEEEEETAKKIPIS
ncbi:MAG: Hsp20/alpha crystallin family protein [Candidatus Omnitrophota bacterium]|jgi:HSP20 family protein|nr:MAG: Hsp20/alpha crystallin family protein [Candidatus Omnitrophota bacterium]